jgi:TonB family protein
MSGPESFKPLPSATGLLRVVPDESNFETNLADLAAHFSAQSGGGLPPELSADLALEIVLNEIAEQACLATGATGAAVVLERDGEMICRASSGPTAPEVGSRLNTELGLSGACFKTRRTQWCDDVLLDSRVDIDGSARLGVRSVVVMPLLRGADLVGVIELFSARPYAFGVRDERTLEVLANRTVNNLEHAGHPLDLCESEAPTNAVEDQPEEERPLDYAPASPSLDVSEVEAAAVEAAAVEAAPVEAAPVEAAPVNTAPVDAAPRDAEDVPRRRRYTIRWLLAPSALVCAVLFGLLLGRQWGSRHANSQPQPALNVLPDAGAKTTKPTAVANAGNRNQGGSPNAAAASPAQPSKRRVPPGGLLVLQNGAEVFRLPPNESPGKSPEEMQSPSSPQAEGPGERSAASVDGSLLHRVEPEYPEAARQQNIQGSVILDVHIGADGAVEEVRVASGPPLLAQAASDALKQWKFKPRLINGRPVEMQTRVTLNFRLAQ